MFTDYYKLINVSSDVADEEIGIAVEKSSLSLALKEEIKMVLQNKSLKELYDIEHKQYEASDSKQSYEINNPILIREIKKVKAFISNKSHNTISIETEPQKRGYSWIGIIVFVIIAIFGKCATSYYKGKALEKNRQKYLRGEYDDVIRYSIDVPHFDNSFFLIPKLK